MSSGETTALAIGVPSGLAFFRPNQKLFIKKY
jgi:hypothetical protein